MTRMTFSQYAASRGVSQPAVSKAVQSGRVTAHVDEKGQRFINKEEADIQWAKTTMKMKEPKPIVYEEPPEPDEVINEPTPSDATQQGAKESKIPPLYQSKSIKEAFLARAAKLKYETDLGVMVRGDEVEKKWTTILSLVRTKVLGIPSKTRQRFPEMPTELFIVLDGAVREALEDLADGGD